MRRTLGFAALAALVACSDSPFNPTTENVSGAYQLFTLVTSTDTGSTNWVSGGATMTLTLVSNGVTTGHLNIPDAGGPGADLDADMAGLWTLSADTVVFDQAADSFVRDMPFFAREGKLVGDHTFGDVRVRIVLVK